MPRNVTYGTLHKFSSWMLLELKLADAYVVGAVVVFQCIYTGWARK